MMVKPMKTLELHYPMIQFLITSDIRCASSPGIIVKRSVEVTTGKFGTVLSEIHFEKKK